MRNKKDKMILNEIPSGTFFMGNSKSRGFALDKEGPVISVTIPSFHISETTVTNEQFSVFVNETGYQTEAEQLGRSFVFRGALPTDIKNTESCCNTELGWWADIIGSNWKHPEGLSSNIQNRRNHPVVHITWNDASAYCEWVGGRLPTEAEWEYAARGGLVKKEYAWGDELIPEGKHQCNIWQGEFPIQNTKKDGYYGTAPVKTYEPNGYGLYQVAGNVWEWCLNPARIPLECFKKYSAKAFRNINQSYQTDYMAIRGGSFLCHHSYCNRYRVAARNGNSAHSSSNNCGFRYVIDLDNT